MDKKHYFSIDSFWLSSSFIDEPRIIIFDLPPVLNLDDAMVVLPHVDATLMVVENGRNTLSEVQDSLLVVEIGKNSQSEVQNAMRLLQGTNIIGTVLNKADEEIRDYY